MMIRPSFQFYPSDWRSNAKLRRCSWGARGVWIEVMGLLHDSNEYGVVRWPLSEIALAIGCPIKLLHELIEKCVLKGADLAQRCSAYVHRGYHARQPLPEVTLIAEQEGPIWYSSRMVLDEYLRHTRGASTRFQAHGGSSNPSPSHSPSQRQGERQGDSPSHSPSQRQGDGASSSSSSSSSLKPKTLKSTALSGLAPDAGCEAKPKKVKTNGSIRTYVPAAESVFNYLNQAVGANFEFRNPKGEVTANARLVIARLAEGYTAKELREVIFYKTEEWKNDDKMHQFLTPATLFARRNFEKYHGAIPNEE